MHAQIAENEPERLAALYRYAVLDTPSEPSFDLITSLAASVFATPIALITLVDPDRQFFKSHYGLAATETPRSDAFCAHAILKSEVLVVPDARSDVRFADNPLVLDDPNIRFYAGAPLETHDGYRLGTLCVIDHKPRLPEPSQINALQALAKQVVELLEFHRARRELMAVRQELLARSRELNQTEARFRAFMEFSPCAAYIKDSSGRLMFVNQHCEDLWHLTPGQWLGKTAADLWPPDMAARVQKVDEEILATGKSAQMTESILFPDGVLRHFFLHKFSFPSGLGEMALGGYALDISERLASEENLRASERRYRELFERNPLPSKIYRTSDLQILDVNQAAITHYGWSREEFLGLKISSIRVEEQGRNSETGLNSGFSPSHPILHRRKDGSEIWVELSSIEIEVDGCQARLCMANDVTDRVESHSHLENLVARRTAELRQSEARWRGLVEALPQFVWSTTPDGSCDYISNEWAEYTGVPLAGLLGNGWLKTLHPDDQARLHADCAESLAAGQRCDMEYRIRARDGSYRWFMSRARPVFAVPNGPIIQWLGTSTDIDDKKRSEERLESAVAERTLALEEARQQAESAARAKTDFLAVVSHELRTPLNGVLGMAHLLEDVQFTTEQRGYLNAIHSNGQSLLNLINEILDFSKIEAGKMELAREEFTLRSVLEESLDAVWPAATAKGVRLMLRLAYDLPLRVIGDPDRLRQILLNLMSNAVKFTEQGEVELSVVGERATNGPLRLHFSVKDTGIGLSSEQLARLFQPFTQADSTNSRRFGGTGLGLSIVKRMLELMGGNIGVSSEPGKGSTFWFDLCLEAGGVAPAAPSPGALEAPDKPGLRGLFAQRQVRILLADDNLSNQQVALGILKMFGLTADVVDDGARALAALEVTPYDLVLMDVRMPRTDGLQATRHIRKAEQALNKRRLPVIAMTASAMPRDVEVCRDAGMDDFVSKPFLPQTLADVLTKWLPAAPLACPAETNRPLNLQQALPLFDVTSLLKRLMGNKSLAKMILDGFLSDMPGQLQSLKNYLQNGNTKQVADQAHMIKGAAAAVSAEAMRCIALKMEMAAEAGDLTTGRECMVNLATQFDLLHKAIGATSLEC
jgi:PAS domain S-box-containing protein